MHLFREHSVDKPYLLKNYQTVLRNLYDKGKIDASNLNTGKPPKKGTFSKDMIITFRSVV
jgi:hypothetical protein